MRVAQTIALPVTVPAITVQEHQAPNAHAAVERSTKWAPPASTTTEVAQQPAMFAGYAIMGCYNPPALTMCA